MDVQRVEEEETGGGENEEVITGENNFSVKAALSDFYENIRSVQAELAEEADSEEKDVENEVLEGEIKCVNGGLDQEDCFDKF